MDKVYAFNLMQRFDLSDSGARTYLLYIERQGLVERLCNRQYRLTREGLNRLEWFDKYGCTSDDCPECTNKFKGEAITCEYCNHLLLFENLRIEKKALLVRPKPGIYCPECGNYLMSVKMAERRKIKWIS